MKCYPCQIILQRCGFSTTVHLRLTCKYSRSSFSQNQKTRKHKIIFLYDYEGLKRFTKGWIQNCKSFWKNKFSNVIESIFRLFRCLETADLFQICFAILTFRSSSSDIHLQGLLSLNSADVIVRQPFARFV